MKRIIVAALAAGTLVTGLASYAAAQVTPFPTPPPIGAPPTPMPLATVAPLPTPTPLPTSTP
jgi:hypothetical protein